MKKYLTAGAFILLCELVGIIGSAFTFDSIANWYAYLNKPFFSPPNYLFGPVWTTLYALMGISVYLIWTKRVKNKKAQDALKLFWIQLALNFIWTPIFFGAKKLLLAQIVIVFMWIFILKTIKAFAKINKTASYLLYPYLAWVSFATLLNFSLWILN